MFQAESEVIDWIYSFRASKKERRLDHLYEMLAKFDNPHQKLKTIHIAGTNGKGSTVAYMREALMQAGYKVATFTSPYIICFGERISINNVPIHEVDLIKYANLLKNSMSFTTLSYTSFDLITLISFLYFSDATVDIAIYETGIGGRLDSTNVITPLATAITNVGHDHADILGETQLERATEKLGIVKAGIPLFTTVEDSDLLVEFEKVCREKNAELFCGLELAQLKAIDSSGVTFCYGPYESVKIKMHGQHQFKNAVLAISLLDYLKRACGFKKIDPPQIANATWQGRFEYVQWVPPVILDGAHNLEGIQALVDTLEQVYPTKKKRFLFSAIATKDAQKMITLLCEVAAHFTFTKGRHPDSIAPDVLSTFSNKVPSLAYDSYADAIDWALDKLAADDVLVICGSLYFISDGRKYLLEKK